MKTARRLLAALLRRWFKAIPTRVDFVVALVIGPVGCFIGSDAKGLPCERDVDCGLRDRCIEGFCGGPPPGGTSTGPGESSSSTAGESEGGPVCGDGKREVGEICEPPSDPVPCGLDCVPLLCGNGNTDPPIEDCDDGVAGERVDTRACDSDCTAVACGDGHWNRAAEYCDGSAAASPLDCDDACRPILFRFDGGPDAFTVELAGGDADAWPAGSGWRKGGGAWSSGPDVNDRVPPANRSLAGCTYLVSPTIDLRSDAMGANWAADVEAQAIPLRWHIAHEIAFAVCDNNPLGTDVGVLAVRVDGAPELQYLDPLTGYPGVLNDQCSALAGRTPNPLALGGGTTPAFTGAAPMETVAVDLAGFVGHSINLVFAACYDCVQCERQMPPGWRILATSVVASMKPAGG